MLPAHDSIRYIRALLFICFSNTRSLCMLLELWKKSRDACIWAAITYITTKMQRPIAGEGKYKRQSDQLRTRLSYFCSAMVELSWCPNCRRKKGGWFAWPHIQAPVALPDKTTLPKPLLGSAFLFQQATPKACKKRP